MDKTLERLTREFTTEETRYSYADSIANAFLTSQIKQLQEDRGFTQDGLAELIGTKQSGISRWLNSGFSTCKVETLRKFARAYGVRLWISFQEFGTLPSDVIGFTKERLAPRRFEDDPAFNEVKSVSFHGMSRPESATAMLTRIAAELQCEPRQVFDRIMAILKERAEWNELIAKDKQEKDQGEADQAARNAAGREAERGTVA